MSAKLNKNSLINYSILSLSIIVLAVYFITPVIISKKESNWKQEVEKKVYSIESEVIGMIENKIEYLSETKKHLSQELLFTANKPNNTKEIFDLLNTQPFKDFSIQVFDSRNNLLAWNNTNGFDKNDIFNSIYDNDEIHFRNYELFTFLSLTSKLNTGDIKLVSLSLPVKKKYTLENEYYNRLDIEEEFENKFSTNFEINYTRDSNKSKDGRVYSFDVLNNFGNKIGVVTFDRPAKDYELNRIELNYNFINSLLIVLIILLIIYKYFHFFINLRSGILRVVVFAVGILSLRIIIFLLNIPSQIFENELLNSSYFSSVFAYGVVRSPLEFFISAVSVLAICIYMLNVTDKYSLTFDRLNKLNIYLRVFFAFTLVVLILFVLRGFGAAIKSVIFDSTLRYFKDPSLIPEPPALLMHINILILGFCCVLCGIVLLILLIRFFKDYIRKNDKIFFLSVFIAIQGAAFLFDVIQEQPQGTAFTRIVYLIFIFLISLLIYYKVLFGVKKILLIALSASFISIILMSFYNYELEKESLKVTALELIRPNENYLDYTVFQTLNQQGNTTLIKEAVVENKINGTQTAFIIWSKSLLQRESIRSRVKIYDSEFIEIGSFNFLFPEDVELSNEGNITEMGGLELTRHVMPDGENNIISGRIRIIEENNIFGYLEVSVIYNANRLSYNVAPPFLTSSLSSFNSTVDPGKLRIFDFHNNRLVNSVSDVDLTEEHISGILADDFSGRSDKWIQANINGEANIIYVLKSEFVSNPRILAIMLKERDVIWNLFDFFKVFFIHTIFILTFFICYFLYCLRHRSKYKITFRSQLIFYFLVISIIPLIMLAVYFKDLTQEKNNSAIFYKLNKRVHSIDSYLANHLYNNLDDQYKIFSEAGNDLGIGFTLYRERDFVFSSETEYYNIGFLENIIDAKAYSLLMNSGMNECMIERSVENYKYYSYYKFIEIRDEEYIIEVNNLFNNILLPFSSIELDVVLFGTYSLVAILVAFFSTLLANQMSRPIRRLTSATKSIASGDLSVEIESKWIGEVKELTDGFNKMVKDLKKNQSQIAEMERESAWKEMAKQVAHEIKNPLTPMKLSVQQLVIAYKDQSPKFENIFEKVTNTIINQIDILKNIASEFSNFARMPNLKLTELNPKNILREVYDLFSEEKTKMALELSDEEITIHADEDQLKRTLVNLVRNSLQSGATAVIIKQNADGNNLLIRVIDNGRGISNEIIHKIFDKEFTTKEKGMGLGLSMAKRFLNSIKGEIEVEHTSETGTTMIIRIPKLSR